MSDPTTIASDNAYPLSTDPVKLINAEQYAEITNYEDALSLVADVFGGEIIGVDELGDGFTVVEEKSTLLSTRFIILDANFYPGEHKREDGQPSEFVSLHVVTKDGRKLIVNDGGSGIYAQLKMLKEKRPEKWGKPISVPKGLRVSRYEHPTYGESETFYLDTSPER